MLVCVVAALCGCSGGGQASSAPPPVTPDFSIAISPGTLSINAGSSKTFSLQVSSVGSFSGTVAVSLAGLPAGVSFSPATLSFAGAGTQTVTLTAAAGAAPVSNVTVTATGVSGSLSHAATFTLSVLGPQSFTLAVSPATLSLPPGANQTVTVSSTAVNGFTGQISVTLSGLPAGITASITNFSLNAGGSTTVILYASTTASGTSTVTFTGTSGSLSASASLSVAINTTPDFALQSGIFTGTGVTAGSTATLSFGATSYNGFSSPITVTVSGLPGGVTASPSTFSIVPGASQSVTFSATVNAPPETTAYVTLQGTSGSLTRSTQFSFSVYAPYLSIAVQPSSLTIPAGSSTSTFVQVLGVSGNSTNPVSVTISGVPAGVTASSSTLTIPGSSPNVFFSAASGAAGTTGVVSLKATYGPYSASTTLNVTVGPAANQTVVQVKSKSKYIRTDSTAGYGGFPPPNWVVFHAGTGRFFSSDFGLGLVNVIDSTTEKKLAALNVPGAFGMDLAPDGSALYVGTLAGDIYVVDPVQLSIVKRYPSNTISPYGFTANAVYALSNGKLLLMRYFLVAGYSFVDGNGPLALWNPEDNSIVKFEPATSQDGLMPEANTCFGQFEFGILTNNRSRFLLTPTLTAEGSSILCSLDPNAGTFVYSPVLASKDGSSLSTLAVSPDGKTVAAFDGTNVYVLDAATLALKSQFAVVSTQTLFQYPSMAIGADNKTLYLAGAQNNEFIYTYDLTTAKQTGWLPAIQLEGSFAAFEPSTTYLQAVSTNGLIAGILDQGVGLIDTNAVNPLPVGIPFGPATTSVPYGPVAGGTTTSWLPSAGFASPATPTLGSIYFGAAAATNTSVTAKPTATLYATSPAGNAGPVDLITVTPDGGEQILPDAFSYGPWVLEAPTNYATAEGGGPASIYGYGLGQNYMPNSNAPAPVPSDLQIQVGGRSATVSGYDSDAYYGAGYLTLPLPLVGATYKVPAGIAGTSSDITVTNSAGSTTVKNALTYLPAVKTFPLNGGTLIDGVYDRKRDVYYFTDTNQVRVFSRTKGQWLTPIVIPKPTGALAAQRLWGVALSPDNSKLAVADFGAIAVYLIDPDNPSSIQSFPYGSQPYGGITESPTGIAVTNSGQVYLATSDENGDGSPYLLQMDTKTGKVSTVGGVFGDPQTNSPFERAGRLPMSADGTRVYYNLDGEIGYINTTTGTLTYSASIAALEVAGYGDLEVVLAPNQTRVFVDQYVTDSQTNLLGFIGLNYREAPGAQYVYGAAMSPDGSLIFQPGPQAIDLFDGRTGAFRGRVSLPVTLTANYRALVATGQDNVLVGITGAGDGLAVIDLSAVQEPAPVPYIDPLPVEAAATAAPPLRTSTLPRANSAALSPAQSQTIARFAKTRSRLRPHFTTVHPGSRWTAQN